MPFPAASLDKAFAWAPAHPVVDAYREFKPMPYDAPSHDLAAMHYTVHPDSGFFDVSEAGTLSVSDAGALTFAPGSGTVRAVTVNPGKKALALEALIETASARPPAPPAGRGRG